jgi:hypothetical protein
MQRRHWLACAGLALGSCGPRLVPVEVSETDQSKTIHVARPKTAAAPVENEDPGDKKAGFADLEWNVLRGLDTRTGQASPLLELIAGTNVRIPGYMVPLDDGFQEVNEFLLVPTAGACIHTPPPPGNQIVYATMSTGRPVKVELIYSVWVYGRLEIASTESPYGAAGFKLGVVEVRRRG